MYSCILQTCTTYMKKSGGPEQKGILRTAVSNLLALISAIYSVIHTGLYTQAVEQPSPSLLEKRRPFPSCLEWDSNVYMYIVHINVHVYTSKVSSV